MLSMYVFVLFMIRIPLLDISVSFAVYKCDHGLCRYRLSCHPGWQLVPALSGQSWIATRITLCPLQANVKDNDAQLKARGAGKKAT